MAIYFSLPICLHRCLLLANGRERTQGRMHLWLEPLLPCLLSNVARYLSLLGKVTQDQSVWQNKKLAFKMFQRQDQL